MGQVLCTELKRGVGYTISKCRVSHHHPDKKTLQVRRCVGERNAWLAEVGSRADKAGSRRGTFCEEGEEGTTKKPPKHRHDVSKRSSRPSSPRALPHLSLVANRFGGACATPGEKASSSCDIVDGETTGGIWAVACLQAPKANRTISTGTHPRFLPSTSLLAAPPGLWRR